MAKKTLYVSNPRARLQRLMGQVVVAVEGRAVERLPAAEIERVLIFGSAQVTTQVLALLLSEGVPVSFFSGRGRYRGQVVGPEGGSVFVRLAQHRRHGEPAFRLALARALVGEKIRGGRRLLQQHGSNHPEDAEVAARALAALDQGAARLPEVADEESLRGVEGAAAAAYFGVFDRMVRAPFRFERRSKHPAHNEVNALLNLGYTLLGNEIAGRLEAAGFDPRVGYYHGVRYGRQSLALDLLEAHRVDVDRLTLAVLNRRMFSPEDFEQLGGVEGVRLRPEALKRYLKLFEAALDEERGAGSIRARVRSQIVSLRQTVLTGETAEFTGGSDGALAGGL